MPNNHHQNQQKTVKPSKFQENFSICEDSISEYKDYKRP